MTSILQWNVRGLVSKWAEFKQFFLFLTPIVIAIQETWFLPTDQYNFSLSQYNLFRFDNVNGYRRHGGVALYINTDFTHSEIDINTPLQAVACTVRLNGRLIDFCSIYIPPDHDNTDLLRSLNDLVKQFNNPFILLGDFNAHNPIWNHDSCASDHRGHIMEDFINTHDLVLLNKGNNTHFSLSHNTESAIDLSLCSQSIATLFDWSIDSDIFESDHYPIKIHTTFDTCHDAVPNFIPRWNLKKANWASFQDLCEINHETFNSPEQGVHFITNKILTAACATIPNTTSPPRHKPVPWWNQEVAQAVAKRKRAFREYLRHKDVHHLVLRNKERSKTKRIIREAKRRSWRFFVSQFTSQTPLSKIWGLVRSLSGKRGVSCLPPLHVNNNIVTEPKQILNTIANSLQRCSSSDNYRENFATNARQNFHLPEYAFMSYNLEPYNVLFTLCELQTAIKSAGNTSVGPDRLHYMFFRKLPVSALKFILNTLNNLWVQHVFPEAWHESIIIPLLKPGKDHKDPTSYRPISLTSCFGKFFERMVVKRLSWYLEEHNILSKFQSGFRPKHSTIDHLIRLETDIRKGFNEKKSTTAVFLDISRAYDMVFKPAVIFKIFKLGITGNLAQYIKGFLSGPRSFQVRYRSAYSDTFNLENGLPQGSCLSPLLFNIMINDLFDDIPPNIRFSLFADDSAIWCSDTDPNHSIPRLQEALNRVENWSKINGCIFSAPKSATVVFTKNSRFQQPSTALRLAGNEIPFQFAFKFLGVILDRRLSMAKHISYIKTKCSKRINLFRCISGTDFGADRRTLLQLYKSLVLPVIEYGSVVYSGASYTVLKKLDSVQNIFLRIATGAMQSSPVHSLQVETVTPPLLIRRIEQTLRYVAKIKFVAEHSALDSIHVLPRIHHSYTGTEERRAGLTIASRVTKICENINYLEPVVQPPPKLTKPPWQLAPRQIFLLFKCLKTSVTKEEIQLKFNRYRAKHIQIPFIFTDGSKEKERTANAVICGQDVYVARLPNNTSIFVAELHAIYVALKIVESRKFRCAVICSDSLSAIQSLLSTTSSTLLTLIINTHQILKDAGVEIQFLWIPGHSGIAGNEKADHSAKRALSLNEIAEVPIEFPCIKTNIRRAVFNFWQDQWINHYPQTQLKIIKPVIKIWLSSFREKRLEEKLLARMRIGHTRLTHDFIFSSSPRPQCLQCNHFLTIEHILIHCQLYQQHRRLLQEYCQKENVDFTLSTLLGNEHPDLIRLLFSFLRVSRLMDKI